VEPPFIAPAASAPVVHPYAGPVDLNWVPPALEQLRAHAAVQSIATRCHTDGYYQKGESVTRLLTLIDALLAVAQV